MKINRDNYEAYFLDYHEGALNPEEMAEVLVFVGLNADLKEQFEEFENISLSADESVRFTGKHILKVNAGAYSGPVTLMNVEEYLVAETEGLLTAEVLAQLDVFLQEHPQFETDRRIYGHTRLVADNQVVYAQKDALKHKAIPAGTVNESNYEEFLVKEVEGLLTSAEASEMDEFVETNPEIESERKLYKMARLQPDKSIVFPAKASLKHNVVPLHRIVYYAMSAAAVMLIFFGVYSVWNNNQPGNQVAVNVITNTKPVVVPQLPINSYQPELNISNNISNKSSDDIAQQTAVVTNRNRPENNSEKTVTALEVRTEVPMMTLLAQNKVTSKQQVAPEFLFIRQSQFYGSRYIDLYNSVKLSEQIQYASLNARDNRPLNTIWRGITGKVEETFVDDQRKSPQSVPEISIWTFAEVGVKAYNNISHDDLELLLQKDEKGNVVSYALVGDKVNFERGVK